MTNMKNFDDQAKGLLDEQKKKEREIMEAKLQKRKTKKEGELQISSNEPLIEDSYEGFEDKKPLLLNDEFLDDLKVMEVPDSDDECYF